MSEMFITNHNTMLKALRAALKPDPNAATRLDHTLQQRAEKNRMVYGDYYLNALNRITKGEL